MKKLLVLLACLFATHTLVKADNDKPIQVSQMPQKAQTFIQQHFGDCKVAMAKMESDFLQKSYDVIFTNGNKVEFDRQGDWTDVDCKFTVVPEAIVPAAIRRYVADNYPDATIVQIELDRSNYEVQLSSGWELKFNPEFQVIDIDN